MNWWWNIFDSGWSNQKLAVNNRLQERTSKGFFLKIGYYSELIVFHNNKQKMSTTNRTTTKPN